MTLHQFYLNNMHMVLDVNSGAVHVVDEATAEVLAVFDGSNDEAVRAAGNMATDRETRQEILGELHELMDKGLLFGPEVATPSTFSQEAVVKSLCLHVAHDCNLRCGYCFAGAGDFGHDRGLMTPAVAEKAIDFLIEHSGGRRQCELDFFGGEPLLNMATVHHAVKYVRQREAETGKQFKLTLTTNALLLDEAIIDFLNTENISVVLSLDGRQEVHDKMRPTVGGAGTFDKVVAKCRQLVDSRQGQNYYLRGTFTAYNLDFAKDVAAMADLGFRQLSVEPVVGKEVPYGLTEAHLPALAQQYEELANHYLACREAGEGYEFFHFNLELDHGPCVAKRLSGCGAGHEYFAVTPDGDLYPCHQFVGREEYLLGNVMGGVKNPGLSADFRQTHVLNKAACRECWAKFFCSGGCHANAQLFNSTIDQPYSLGCELQKKRLECALMIQAYLSLKNRPSS